MANPVVVPCPAGVWTKVATAVITGVLHLKETGPVYLQTYRLTGEAAPTLVAEGARIEGTTEFIESTDPIDVYVWAQGTVGAVRVDV